MAAGRSIVVLTPGGGHAQRLLPLVECLVRRGRTVHVMTREAVRPAVEAAGGDFFDLDAHFPIEAADASSLPAPMRFVAFAAAYAEPLTRAVAALAPSLLIYDSFVVAGPIVARRLGIPYVGMRAGHAQAPDEAVAEMARDPRVVISDACRAAVETLRWTHGVADASSFSWLQGVSPWLNLYPEPPDFLDSKVARQLEPLAFFGSLAPELRDRTSRERPLASAPPGVLRLYVSFGTVVWRYYAPAALAAMRAIVNACAGIDAALLLSLGHHAATPEDVRNLARPNVRLERVVDQWGALKDADLFVTHHGLNSTHEAIFHRVPMLSYPFVGDQLAMARRCQQMGVAVPLGEAPCEPLDVAEVRDRIKAIRSARESMTARLADARARELETIAARGSVIDRVLSLA